MVEVVGDLVMPSELIVPEKTGRTGTNTKVSGANLFISGHNLFFELGSITYTISGQPAI